MISKYKDNLITDPHLALIPGMAITILVLAFFMIGNGLRDAMDIRIQSGS
jgi:peptide/nickel transport system permease protein